MRTIKPVMIDFDCADEDVASNVSAGGDGDGDDESSSGKGLSSNMVALVIMIPFFLIAFVLVIIYGIWSE